ncbi:hypothetical protein M407DRAFT_204764 [Tulasnella calospora MUT 4182]|uniref:Protein YOP1 n=1 Tax=Tulasnella calospora MUT 4182 TaxID=1051891 RepID=A0A0C3QKN9_9AGAM|nr:hypothetical protein M407DRAFT_204764 [Tulasnella calospora MUT 4182]
MFFRFIWSLLSSTIAYAYPAYASFKSLSRRPAEEAELERWLMYWSVVGCIVALEHVAEWTISWIPFYWFMKAIFLLWLALPQTQGASYIFQAHLAPFLHNHEPAIDQHLAQFKSRLYTFVQDRLRELWTHISSTVAQHTGINLNQIDPSAAPTGAAQASQPQGQVAQGAQMAMNLWQAWGPTLLASLRPPPVTSSSLDEPIQHSQQPSASSSTQTIRYPPSAPAPSAPTASASSSRSKLDTLRAKQAALAAQIAAELEREKQGGDVSQSVYLSETGSPSEASLNSEHRTIRDSGLYEEIQRDELDEQGSEPDSPNRRNSWFSGWRRNSGYQPLKQD